MIQTTHEYMGWKWGVVPDWSRRSYPEVTAVMRTPFGGHLVETTKGWYVVADGWAVNRSTWQGPFATWQDAATVRVAQHALGE